MNRTPRTPALIALLLAAAMLWPAAHAAAQETAAGAPPPSQNPAANMGGRRACMADMQKFCAEVERGGGRKLACMRSHEAELSDACKTALAERRAMHRDRLDPPPSAGNATQQAPAAPPN